MAKAVTVLVIDRRAAAFTRCSERPASLARRASRNTGSTPALAFLCLLGDRARLLGEALVVDPLLFEAGIAFALAGHLPPAGEQPRRGEQQAVAQMGRVQTVLLEGRNRDLLVVRVVLKAAGAECHGFLISPAVGARFQIGVGDCGGARK